MLFFRSLELHFTFETQKMCFENVNVFCIKKCDDACKSANFLRCRKTSNERVNCTDKLDNVNGDNMFRFNAYSVMVMPECQNKLDGMTFEKKKIEDIYLSVPFIKR